MAVPAPGCAQVAVFGVTEERMGEEVRAWVQLHEGATVTIEDLRAYAGEGFAHYQVPRHVRIVDSCPMTVTGNIQKFRTREMRIEELNAARSS